MRLKHLRGLPVIDPGSARKIGTVFDYQVDPASGHVAALDVTRGAETEGERVLAHRVRRVGRNAVILTAPGGTEAGTAPEVDARWLDATTLGSLEVIGDDGNRVGRLQDALFNQDSLEIESYVLQSRFYRRVFGTPRLPPARVQACSRELMLVSSGRLKELPAVSAAPVAALEEPPAPALRTPLKTDDRLSAPSFEPVSDGQTAGARSA